jgi:1,2-diacylglycerol 3-beta-galactosyltransferase
MSRKAKVLILTGDAGFGHRKAALAISNAISKIYGGRVECAVVNPMGTAGAPRIMQKSQTDYDDTVRNHRSFYQFTYQASDHYPINRIADQVISQLNFRQLRRTIAEERPDAIISTYHLYNTAVRRILEQRGLPIPFYSVVTDLDRVHSFWFHPGPDTYFVATEELVDQAVEQGVAAEKVIASGIPVDTRIADETREPSEIRQQLGWDSELPALLVVGSRRVHNLLEKLAGIEACGTPLQLAVVAGGDEALYRAVKGRHWKVPTFCYGYAENIPEMMRAADVLITKAGGLVVSEGLASGLPMILVDAIVGQETANLDYVLRHMAGVWAPTTEAVRETVCRWLSGEREVLGRYARNARRIGKPGAAYQVARCVAGQALARQAGETVESGSPPEPCACGAAGGARRSMEG